jgi:hypothetical protein
MQNNQTNNPFPQTHWNQESVLNSGLAFSYPQLTKLTESQINHKY